MLGENIKEYLAKKGIKQRYVAEQAGINENKFSLMLREKQTINAEDYLRICDVLNVPPSLFVGASQS